LVRNDVLQVATNQSVTCFGGEQDAIKKRSPEPLTSGEMARRPSSRTPLQLRPFGPQAAALRALPTLFPIILLLPDTLLRHDTTQEETDLDVDMLY